MWHRVINYLVKKVSFSMIKSKKCEVDKSKSQEKYRYHPNTGPYSRLAHMHAGICCLRPSASSYLQKKSQNYARNIAAEGFIFTHV